MKTGVGAGFLIFALSTNWATRSASADCSGCTKPAFRAAVREFDGGPFPGSIGTADLNGDWIPDIVTGSGGNVGGFNVLLGNGTGGFEPPVIYPGGSTPRLVIADFNGDGIPDVATGGPDVAVRLGLGDGTFGPAAVYSLSGNSGPIAVGDFNGDGIPDLVVEEKDFYTAVILLGAGDGTFQTGIELHFPPYSPEVIVVADFNGDGRQDLAMSYFSSENAVGVFLGNGDGSFGAPVTSGIGSTHMVVGDFNGDGRPDLALDEFTYVAILFGSGDGTFTAGPRTPDLGAGSLLMAPADFNHDGKLDLAVAIFQSIQFDLLLGHGDGTFDTPISTPVNSSGPIILADFDSNGTLDVAIASDLVEVLLSDGPTSFPQTQTYFTGGASNSVAIAELTGDAIPDLVVSAGATTTVAIARGLGDGTFAAPYPVAVDASPSHVSTGDLNGDTFIDVVVTTLGGIQVLLGRGDGTFQTLPSFGLNGNPPIWTTLADLNEDGLLDVVVANDSPSITVFLGNGDGTFQPGMNYAATFSGEAAIAADFDGDGHLDLAVAGIDRLTILLGDGSGSFTPAGDYGSWWAVSRLAVADLDGDGNLDIVVTHNGDETQLDVFRGNGGGTFQPAVGLPYNGYPLSITAADIDGDGVPDLVLNNFFTMLVLRGTGGGGFQPFYFDLRADALVVGDLNGDGKPDIAGAGGYFSRVLLNSMCQARRLGMVAQPSRCDLTGSAFAAQPSVGVYDEGDNLMVCDSETVTAALVPGTGAEGAILLGATSATTTAGIAAFSDLAVDRSGRGYRLAFSHPLVQSTVSRTFTQGLDVLVVGAALACAGTVTGYRTGTGGYEQYAWSLDGSSFSRAPSVVLSSWGAGSHVLSVAVTEDGCEASTSVNVEVSQTPLPPPIAALLFAPVGGTDLIASVSSNPLSTFQWSVFGGVLTGGQGTDQITFDAGGPGTLIELRAAEVSAAGCESGDSLRAVQVDFLDVPPSNPFHDDVDTLALRGFSSGCGNGNYCAPSLVTRAQMMVFALRGEHGASYLPPPLSGGTMFLDVGPGDFAAAFIQEAGIEGITGGCGGGNFCPSAPVSRAQAAVFLLNAEHGAGYVPPPATGTVFSDVHGGDFAADYIEQLAHEGVTAGCGGGNYCPTVSLTRGQIAAFLVRTFNLSLF